jgi:hypothetical protein
MSAANAQTLKATWSACDDCDGYRVYEYKNGEKILLQESSELSFQTDIIESVVIGVVGYNSAGESEVIPRLVAYKKDPPEVIKMKIEIIVNGIPTVIHDDLEVE